jgi:predicted O-methyltransferase YrrM
VEVGTATGYGAIHMGCGFERNAGHLTTIEIDPRMAEAARQNIAGMKLEKSISIVQGDALKVIPKLEGQFDFVFLDAVKRDYLKYFKGLEPLLKPGTVIIADNAIQSAKEMQDFFDAVRQDPNYHMVILRASDEKKDGMAVIYKLK